MSANLLPPRSKEYFDRTRSEDAGMPLPQFLAETEEHSEEAWQNARPGLRELGELLEENGKGPFFMGDVGELVFALLVERRGRKGRNQMLTCHSELCRHGGVGMVTILQTD